MVQLPFLEEKLHHFLSNFGGRGWQITAIFPKYNKFIEIYAIFKKKWQHLLGENMAPFFSNFGNFLPFFSILENDICHVFPILENDIYHFFQFWKKWHF